MNPLPRIFSILPAEALHEFFAINGEDHSAPAPSHKEPPLCPPRHALEAAPPLKPTLQKKKAVPLRNRLRNQIEQIWTIQRRRRTNKATTPIMPRNAREGSGTAAKVAILTLFPLSVPMRISAPATVLSSKFFVPRSAGLR